MRGINGDWPRVMTAEVKRVRSNTDSLSIVDGMIMMNSRIYVEEVTQWASRDCEDSEEKQRRCVVAQLEQRGEGDG